jgi:hypothetical protein
VVRNIIEIDKIKPSIEKLNKIRVGFSPSTLEKRSKWFDKGYLQTKSILEKVKRFFPTEFEFDIVTGVSLVDCLARLNRCNIIIDECVTPSYHRCSLQGLSMGKITLCSMSNEMEGVLKRYAPTIPIVNVWIIDLEETLVDLIHAGTDYIYKKGAESRKWIETYWRPEDIIKEYTDIYEDILC